MAIKNRKPKTVKITSSSDALFEKEYGLYGKYIVKRQKLIKHLKNTTDPEERKKIINELNEVSEILKVV